MSGDKGDSFRCHKECHTIFNNSWICVCGRHWKGIEPGTSHTLCKCYTSLLFSKLIVLKEFFSYTHMQARSRAWCMHACSHNWRCQQESRRGHWIPCRWSCPVGVLGKFSARHGPVCAPKHRAILSSSPTPTSVLSPETGSSSSIKASLEILVFMPQPSM